MKKLIFPFIIGALLFVTGCNEENDLQTGTKQSDELSIIKTYDTDLGKLEAYYINEEMDAEHEENDIGLKITSVEYGKVTLEEEGSIYEKLADEDGKNTYLKVGVELDADKKAYEQDDITFFIYQATINVKGKKMQADSISSDKVYINRGKVEEMDKGYLYFIIDATLPITSLKLNVPAPFKEDGSSISDNYEFKIDL